MSFPTLRGIVLDCPSPRELAEFYRQLLGWEYAPGHEQVDPAGDAWLVLRSADGVRLAFQEAKDHRPPTWPDPEIPQQLHLDLAVDDLPAAHEHAVALGARFVSDSTDPDDVFTVFTDPAGHPFCLCVIPPGRG